MEMLAIVKKTNGERKNIKKLQWISKEIHEKT